MVCCMTTLSTWMVKKGIIRKMKVDQIFPVLMQESTSDQTQFNFISKILSNFVPSILRQSTDLQEIQDNLGMK